MAEIKVKRKAVVPWWLLLLLALVTAGLLWWVVSSLRDDDGRVGAPASATGPAGPGAIADGELRPARPGPGTVTGSDLSAAAGEPITTLAAITGAGDPAALVGREVRLDEVPVQRMEGDATFWVGERGRPVFVILDQVIPSPPATVEGRVNVNAGQTVRLAGTVRRADDLPGGDVLDADDRAALRGQPIYIRARSAEVVTPTEFAPQGPPGVVRNR